jgi:predicted nuclease of predicted toxin-antitoxin system
MRFHLDEHIDPAIAHGLRRRGIDVTTTNDANLVSAPDESHLEFASREASVIFNNDPDFLRLASTTTEHLGLRTALVRPTQSDSLCATCA